MRIWLIYLQTFLFFFVSAVPAEVVAAQPQRPADRSTARRAAAPRPARTARAAPTPPPVSGTPVAYEYVTDDSTEGSGTDAMAWDAFTGRRPPQACRVTEENSSRIRDCITTATAGGGRTARWQIDELYNATEAEVMIGLTGKIRDMTQCQLDFASDYSRAGSATRTNIDRQVADRIAEQEEALTAMRARIAELSAAQRRLSVGVQNAYNYNITASNSLNRQIADIEGGYSVLINEFPMGNQPKIHTRLLEVFKRGGGAAEITAAYQAGIRDYQTELASSRERLLWALAQPGTTDAAKEERFGPAGVTNRFKRELLNGSTQVVREYFDSLGLAEADYSGMLCRIENNHVRGPLIRERAWAIAEFAGIVGLSIILTPAAGAGAAATAGVAEGAATAITVARSTSMAGRLLRLGEAVEAGQAARYAAVMAPALPSIAARCLGSGTPAYVQAQQLSGPQNRNNAVCSAAGAVSFTEAEGVFYQCSTEIAFTSAVALVPFARYLRGRSATLANAEVTAAGEVRAAGSVATTETRAGSTAASSADNAGGDIVVTGRRSDELNRAYSNDTISRNFALGDRDRRAAMTELCPPRNRGCVDALMVSHNERPLSSLRPGTREVSSKFESTIDDLMRTGMSRSDAASAASRCIRSGLCGSAQDSNFISFVEASSGRRITGEVVGRRGDGMMVRTTSDGPIRLLNAAELGTTRPSSLSRLLNERTQDASVNSFRTAFSEGRLLQGDNAFISFVDTASGNRIPGMIMRVNDDGTLLVLRQDGTEITLSATDMLSARLSSTSATAFRSSAPQAAPRSVASIFRGQPAQTVPADTPVLAARNFTAADGSTIRFRVTPEADFRTAALREGNITEFTEGARATLQPGTYTYLVTQDGRLVIGRVEDTFEYGVKHLNLANGRPVVTAGELRVGADGRYQFNLESGTFTRQLENVNGVNRTELAGRTDETLRRFLGNGGRYENVSLAPTSQPSLSTIRNFCSNRNFLIINREACCTTVRIGCN